MKFGKCLQLFRFDYFILLSSLSLSLKRNINIDLRETVKFCLFYMCVRVFLCEREMWSLAPREEHSFRVLKNRVLGIIYESKRGEVIREWKNYTVFFRICDLCVITLGRRNQERRVRYDMYITLEMKMLYKMLFAKPEGMIPFRKLGGRKEK
jgi:hypothetical protein